MVAVVQHLLGPAAFPAPLTTDNNAYCGSSLSVLSYNVLLPNSQDGWWTYKMYLPPVPVATTTTAATTTTTIASWDYRRNLLSERIAQVDADVVCLQEVSPLSFDDDFAFMADLGYDGREMFKKGRFRPATFWKTERCELVAPPVHKDRVLLTAFRRRPRRRRRLDGDGDEGDDNYNSEHNTSQQQRNWYVLNCHLQAGKQAPRRLRQIHEGVRAVLTLARQQHETTDDPEARRVPLIVCGDFNGGPESAAVRYLEDGAVDEHFREDGEPVTSSPKKLPLEHVMTDVAAIVQGREPPPTLVVSELISTIVDGGLEGAYENPELSSAVVERLRRIYKRCATATTSGSTDGGDSNDDATDKVMGLADVERFLIAINGEVGRGSEFREAARQMGWSDDDGEDDNSTTSNGDKKRRTITLPESILSLEGFIRIYEAELKQGKFWGIAHDLAVLGEPLPDAGVFQSRYDRMYCSSAVQPTCVMDFVCTKPCPNDREPSDHLPVAASFSIKESSTY